MKGKKDKMKGKNVYEEVNGLQKLDIVIRFHLEDCILPPWLQRLKLIRERRNTSYTSFAMDSRCLEAFHCLKERPRKRRERECDK